jgi:hypothetical protein
VIGRDHMREKTEIGEKERERARKRESERETMRSL